MRILFILPTLMLGACATGTMQTGYDDGYDPYRASREAALQGGGDPVLITPPEPGAGNVAGGTGPITGNELAAAGIGTGGASAASTFQGDTFGTGTIARVEPVQPGGNVGISDEQDFGAVSSRESIQSDAERLAAQREAYQVIQPEPVPQRPSDTGPNIVSYALATSNQPGEQVYSRSGQNSQSRFQRNCAKYSSSDKAQEAFLESGGPQRDRMGLDPDGDGFACYWDPRPFRAARGG